MRRLILSFLVASVFFTTPLWANEPDPVTVANLQKEIAAKGLEPGDPVMIRVFKQWGAPRTNLKPWGYGYLELWMMKKSGEYVLAKSFKIDNFSGKLGPKLKQGDLQAIEGVYTIVPSGLNTETKFHLSLNTGYPNAYDQYYGRTGDYILIHGQGVSVGCFAFSDENIDQIFYLVSEAFRQNIQDHVQVFSYPFPPTDLNLSMVTNRELKDFWSRLAVGYNQFEATKREPLVTIENGEYIFHDENGSVLPAIERPKMCLDCDKP